MERRVRKRLRICLWNSGWRLSFGSVGNNRAVSYTPTRALGLFLSNGSWKRLGHGLALIFVSQSGVRAMHRITGLMTAAVWLAATTAGIGNGTAAQIA